MQVTLKQIYNSVTTLNSLVTQKMSAVLAYKIHKLVGELNEHLDAIEKARVNLVTQLADESGKNVASENMQKFSEEMETVFAQQVDIKWKKIPLSNLENLELSPIEVESILYLLDV